MPRPTGPTDPNMTKLIYDFRKTKKKNFVILARHLEKARRVKTDVNISKLLRVGGTANCAVPGKLLAAGEVSVPIKVYAFSFSKQAKEKIEKAGGKCLPLNQLVKDNIKFKIVM
ncbi:MAG TPA: 50S ribosomal protein L18e [archaeon]|nr:50S ribosomal protein L18e [Candidatus Nanoarchaeia archaeon]HLD84984.1 50S ribosomal protein L18e [archaeon]